MESNNNNSQNEKKQTTKRVEGLAIDKKIEIFERFLKLGIKLNGQTVFEGHKIGQWAIQIRSISKKVKQGKCISNYARISLKDIEKLEAMGILDRCFESSIDEKIIEVVEWSKKYPDIKLDNSYSMKKELRKYVSSEEEFEALYKRYYKAKGYYGYIRARKSNGKLTETQILTCKEGNVGGVFGWTSEVEILSQKYNIPEDIIYDFYVSKKSIKEIRMKCKKNEDQKYKFKSEFDFDFNEDNSRNYDCLVRKIYGSKDGIIFYSSKQMKDLVEELPKKERIIIERRFGLKTGTPETCRELANELEYSYSNVSLVENMIIEKLRNKLKQVNYRILTLDEDIDFMNSEFLSEEEKAILHSFYSNNIFLREREYSFIKENIDSEALKGIEILKSLCEREGEIHKSNEEITIEEMEFSRRVVTALKKINITTLEELLEYVMSSKNAISTISNIGEKCQDEIRDRLEKFGGVKEEHGKWYTVEEYAELEAKRKTEKERADREMEKVHSEGDFFIEELHLSCRSFKCLKNAGIKVLSELVSYANSSEDALLSLPGFGVKSYEELKCKLKKLGFKQSKDGKWHYKMKRKTSSKDTTTEAEKATDVKVNEEFGESLEEMKAKKHTLVSEYRKLQTEKEQTKVEYNEQLMGIGKTGSETVDFPDIGD